MRHRFRVNSSMLLIPTCSLVLLLALGIVPVAAATTRDCADRVLEPGADLRRCDLRALPVAGANLSDAILDRAVLAGMNLDNGPDGPETTLANASLVRADLHDAILSASNFGSADLSSADLSGVQLEDTRLADSLLRGANLTGASFFFTDVARADLQRADLREAGLTHSVFVEADFDRAQVDGADFTGANLTGASFDRVSGLATVTWAHTTCPDGANSDDVGGSCIGHL
jgi:uncharacterized protein YjbI with pentapeptide repeats